MEAKNRSISRGEMLEKLRTEVVGLNVTYQLATGEETRRIYLDSTASTLRLQAVEEVLRAFQPYYSNTHSVLHFGARLSTAEYHWAHRMVLRFTNADPETYTCFFVGSGTTGGINRVARTMREKRPERDVVITTIMEHHSNDLPHRKHFRHVEHIPAAVFTNSLGCVDLSRLEHALKKHAGRVNYVAITGVSNVTGIINPIHEIARLAHEHGALIIVDAAQMAAHVPIHMSGNADPASDLDILVFSGHKIYAPGSPGVVVGRKELFLGIEPTEVGGGMVEDVYIDTYTATEKFPDREEAGTPNICGAIGLAAALYALDRVGMRTIEAEESRLMAHALRKLGRVKDIVIYGETDLRKCRRTGAISFNIKGLDHAFTAAVLNDYFNIAVRNHCFCAHPYVREMILQSLSLDAECLSDISAEHLEQLQKGMVRASFGIYTTEQDVDMLAHALQEISKHRSRFAAEYEVLPDGNYIHKTFTFDPKKLFSIERVVEAYFAGAVPRKNVA